MTTTSPSRFLKFECVLKTGGDSSGKKYLKCFIEDENFESLSFYRRESFKRWLTDLRNSYPVYDN